MVRVSTLMPLLLLSGCLFVSDAEQLAHTDRDGDGVPASEDCDDGDSAVSSPTEETCNGVDDDCDGRLDEGLLPDQDGDGYGADGPVSGPCFANWVSTPGDCDDDARHVFPGAPERCDGVLNDCLSPWIPTDELGVVTWEAPQDLLREDLSASFAAGIVGAPVDVTLPPSGTVRICSKASPYAVRLVGEDTVDLALIGLSIPTVEDPEGLPILNASDSGEARGAVIEITGEDWRLTVRGLRIVGGQGIPSRPGGGLHLAGGDYAHLAELEVTANLAPTGTEGGAGLYIDDVGTVALVDSRVSQNTAEAGALGGGILARDVELRMDAVVFDSNTTPSYGGAVALRSGRLEAYDSVFTGNRAFDGGGALHLAPDTDAYVYETDFTENAADQGGAAWIEGALSCFDVRDTVTFSDQEAVYRGAVWATFGAGVASFAGCTTAGSWISSGNYVHAVANPDLYAGEPADPEGLNFSVVGDELFCTSTYCAGDVEVFDLPD